MSNKMLIDATHPEETRVVVLRGNKVEDFDFEAAERQQLRGNIYLARVTRVEPSLQAAFIEYGGNRHGFLAFSEIHPDYYQIPFADRQALLQEQAREDAEHAAAEAAADAAAEAEEDGAGDYGDEDDGDDGGELIADGNVTEVDAVDDDAVETIAADTGRPDEVSEAVDAAILSDPRGPEDDEIAELRRHDADLLDAAVASAASGTLVVATGSDGPGDEGESDHDDSVPHQSANHGDDLFGEADAAEAEEPSPIASGQPTWDEPEDADDHAGSDDHAEDGEGAAHATGGDDAVAGHQPRRRTRARQYKIQEVIKRRQVILVQVVKEERGNKGAALTTYLSLAGRYSVLMPNSGRGGGISRKITNTVDRRRLKEIAGELDVPEGMGVILRTAGANRTKPEVKRDFEYLLRVWETVRELTLRSSAPQLVYEEGDLIKRSIRDLYSREIESIVVAGEEGYREARDFMRMLMPSHAKNVQLYRDDAPIFARNGVEAQLDAMFSPRVTLKSGGYIVINQTEALVAIDVNSGRSTREHNIEDTALNTNLEAAEEITRQLRLRDLAGLIVIDFIDMEENRNNRAVERKLKDCLRADRARIQVGRISHFGLLEMSRQRMRTGVIESSTVHCPTCHGTGQVRSISSLALQMLRAIEDHLMRNSGHHLYVRTRPEVALYVLNQKRAHLTALENRFDLSITVSGDTPENGHGFVLERGEPAEPRVRAIPPAPAFEPEPEPEFDGAETSDEDEAFDREGNDPESIDTTRDDDEAESGRDGEGRERGRRRRRRRGGRSDAERGGDERTARSAARSGEAADESETVEPAGEGEEADAAPDARADSGSENGIENADGRRRRRGRRGGRRRGRGREGEERLAGGDGQDGNEDGGDDEAGDGQVEGEDRFESDRSGAEFAPADVSDAESALSTPRAASTGSTRLESAVADQVAGVLGTDETDEAAPFSRDSDPAALPEPVSVAETVPDEAPVQPATIEDDRPKRSGWWSRKLFS